MPDQSGLFERFKTFFLESRGLGRRDVLDDQLF